MLALFSLKASQSQGGKDRTSPTSQRIELNHHTMLNFVEDHAPSHKLFSEESFYPRVPCKFDFRKNGICECCVRPVPMQQNLDELEWERGIWGASKSGNVQRLKELFLKGHDVDARDGSGYSALHYAARGGHVDACRLLLQTKANVNATTTLGCGTALMRSCIGGHLEVCRLLVQHSADLTTADTDGQTSLHKAAAAGAAAIVALLLSHLEVDPVERDSRGATPADVAPPASADVRCLLASAVARRKLLTPEGPSQWRDG